MNSQEFGKAGENTAARYCLDNGFEVICRNFRSKFGEIEIVSVKGELLIFLEVKNRNYYGADNLGWVIDEKRKRRMVLTSRLFLLKHPEYGKFRIRFDLLFLRDGEVEYFENIIITESNVA